MPPKPKEKRLPRCEGVADDEPPIPAPMDPREASESWAKTCHSMLQDTLVVVVRCLIQGRSFEKEGPSIDRIRRELLPEVLAYIETQHGKLPLPSPHTLHLFCLQHLHDDWAGPHCRMC